jgi:FKBP-type peptidyl-prolyl cis-trans isomerase FkpA
MNRILALTLTVALGSAPLFAADAPAAPAAPAKPAAKAASAGATFKTEDERTFYAYGYKIGENISRQLAAMASASELKAVAKGLQDSITGKPEAVNMAVYLPKFSDLATKRVSAKADGEKAKGRAYAETFSKEDGVKPIPTGGFIKTLTEGAGATPTADDTVKVHYRGTLIDGTEFDSSYKRNEPAMFPLKNVIPCWTNGVAMMKVGGKAKLVCPSDAAYGDQGHPPTIPGGATLNFEVELLEIIKPEAPKAEAPAKPVKK